jgi:hypothetical protein
MTSVRGRAAGAKTSWSQSLARTRSVAMALALAFLACARPPPRPAAAAAFAPAPGVSMYRSDWDGGSCGMLLTKRTDRCVVESGQTRTWQSDGVSSSSNSDSQLEVWCSEEVSVCSVRVDCRCVVRAAAAGAPQPKPWRP